MIRLTSMIFLILITACKPSGSPKQEDQGLGGLVQSSAYQRSSGQAGDIPTTDELNPLLLLWNASMIPTSSQSPKEKLPVNKKQPSMFGGSSIKTKPENRYYQRHSGQLSISYSEDTTTDSIYNGFSPQQSRANSSFSSVSDIKRVILSVRAVEVHSTSQGWLLAADFGGREREVELSTSGDGTPSGLAGLLLDKGNYTQVRLILGDSNAVYLNDNGNEKAHALNVPSGAESGIKLIRPFSIVDDGITTFSLKFDIQKSIVFNKGQGYLLKPVVKIDVANTSSLISQTISGDTGGTIEIADLASLRVLQDATAGDVKFSMQMVDCCDSIPNVPLIGPVIDFGPDEKTFDDGAALLTFSYDPSVLESLGISESELGIYYLNEDTGNWTYIGGTVDEENKTITGMVTHFSLMCMGYYYEILYDGKNDMPLLPDYRNNLGESFKFPADIPNLADRGWKFYEKFDLDPDFNVPTTHEYPFAQKEDGCSGIYAPNEVRDTYTCFDGKVVDFTSACNAHDHCYYSLHTKPSECNEPFAAHLLDACYVGLRTPILSFTYLGEKYTEYGVNATCFKYCTYIAGIMSAAVSGGAFAFHASAQAKQDEYKKWIIELEQEFNFPPNCNLTFRPKIGTTKSYIDLSVNFPDEDGRYKLKNTNVSWQQVDHNRYLSEVDSGFYSVTVYSPDETSTSNKEATCSVTIPGINSLMAYHSGCDSASKSQTPECVSAVHRACNAIGYGMGLPQEASSSGIGVGCFDPVAYGEVSFDILRTYHDGCDSPTKSQTAECAAAARRFCNDSGFNQGGVLGEAQEAGTSGLGIGCFVSENDLIKGKAWYGNVTISELSQHNSDCNTVSMEQTPACASATHRACVARGFNMGTPQEIGNSVFGVGCFNAPYYGVISVQ